MRRWEPGLEWRSRAEGTDYLLKVQEDDGQILSAWEADPELLRDFLNDMTGFAGDGAAVSNNEQDPLGWGRLVLARSEDGDALEDRPRVVLGRDCLLVPVARRRPTRISAIPDGSVILKPPPAGFGSGLTGSRCPRRKIRWCLGFGELEYAGDRPIRRDSADAVIARVHQGDVAAGGSIPGDVLCAGAEARLSRPGRPHWREVVSLLLT